MEIINMKISSQAFTQENYWEIIKKFKIIKDGKSPSYKYILKCKKCGYEKEVSQSGIYKKSIWCPQCSANEEIGKQYQNLKILEFVGREESKQRKHGGDRLYKCQCINCGHIFAKKRISDIRNSSGKCKYCNMPTEDAGINIFLRSYKYEAKSRGYNFDLTPKEFENIISKNCYYCGQPPREHNLASKSLSKKYYTIKANGIDRFDNTKGYTLNNCVPCCTNCNYMKRDLSYRDFKLHIINIYNNIVKEGSTTISTKESTSNVDGNGEIPPDKRNKI